MINEFYKYIANNLKNSYEQIRTIISHNGEKGIENELLLIDFIKGFLPQSYSIGRGFIIDSENVVSNQCDIVIYDNFYNPSLLNFGSNIFFPIESVYGVIEVKTCIRKDDIEKSYQAFNKIKNMKFLTEHYSTLPDNAYEEINKPDGTLFFTSETLPPFYFLFGFDSEWKSGDSILTNFKSIIKNELFFDTAIILNAGILQYYKDSKTLNISVPKLFDDTGNILSIDKNEDNYIHNGMSYRTIKIEGKYYPVNYARNIVVFLYMLNDQINKRSKMGKKYLNSYFGELNGFLNLQMKNA